MQWSGWIEIMKVAGGEERIVEGFASTETPDAQGGYFQGQHYLGDIVDSQALKAALPDYMAWANLREMHENSAVGKVISAEVIDGEVEVDGRAYRNPLHIVAKIVDDAAWEKTKAGVYQGFSIGGKMLKAVIEKIAGAIYRRITELALVEISLVDRPANPEARLLLWKLEGSPESDRRNEQPLEGGDPMSHKIEGTPVELITAPLQKAADPAKALSQIQALRDQAELDGDLEGAALYTQAIALMMQASGDASAPAETEPPEEEPPAEDGSAPEAGMDGESGATPPEEDELFMAAGSKPQPTAIRKAGRSISGGNMQAMHSVIQALAKMMAGAGDPVAGEVLKCYGTNEEQKAAAPSLDETALRKIVGEAAGGPEVIEKLQAVSDSLARMEQASAALGELAGRIEKLERQPAPGGPVMRQVADKTLPTQVKDAPAETPPQTPIEDLRKAAALEPDPFKRALLNQEIVRRELALTRR